MMKLFGLPILYLLFSAFNCLAQSPSCVEGDFLKDMGRATELNEAEIRLCNEVKENSDLLEIYGFVITAKVGQTVRFYKDRVVFTHYEDNVRYKERRLTDGEVKTLRTKLNEAKLKTQPPLRDYARCTDMCLQFEFVSINRNGGRRVAIFSPRYTPPAPMNDLGSFFNELQRSGEFETYYYIQRKASN
jgi:hypothetical protein